MKTEPIDTLPCTPKKRKASNHPTSPSSPSKKAWTMDDKVNFLLYMVASYGHKTLSKDHKRGIAALLDRSERAVDDFHLKVIKPELNRIVQEMDNITERS